MIRTQLYGDTYYLQYITYDAHTAIWWHLLITVYNLYYTHNYMVAPTIYRIQLMTRTQLYGDTYLHYITYITHTAIWWHLLFTVYNLWHAHSYMVTPTIYINNITHTAIWWHLLLTVYNLYYTHNYMVTPTIYSI